MSKTFNIAQQIRALKAGKHFFVYDEKDRQLANREAATLRRAGVIEFEVTTRAAVDERGRGGFKVGVL